MSVTENILQDITTIRRMIHNFKGFKERGKKMISGFWTEERKKEQRESGTPEKR